jgi:hypothetical protein
VRFVVGLSRADNFFNDYLSRWTVSPLIVRFASWDNHSGQKRLLTSNSPHAGYYFNRQLYFIKFALRSEDNNTVSNSRTLQI